MESSILIHSKKIVTSLEKDLFNLVEVIKDNQFVIVIRFSTYDTSYWQKWRMVTFRFLSRLNKSRTIERLIDSMRDHSNKNTFEIAEAAVRRCA